MMMLARSDRAKSPVATRFSTLNFSTSSRAPGLCGVCCAMLPLFPFTPVISSVIYYLLLSRRVRQAHSQTHRHITHLLTPTVGLSDSDRTILCSSSLVVWPGIPHIRTVGAHSIPLSFSCCMIIQFISIPSPVGATIPESLSLCKSHFRYPAEPPGPPLVALHSFVSVFIPTPPHPFCAPHAFRCGVVLCAVCQPFSTDNGP